MLDVNTLTPAATIRVEATDRIFRELGNNTYDYRDLLSELIDNCIAARTAGQLLTVTVDVLVDDSNNAVEFVISDDASGIPQETLALAVTPAGINSHNSLNEHGLGMKQAVSAIGRLNYLATKTAAEPMARVIREFRFGDLQVFTAPYDRPKGTTISVVDIKPIVVTNSATMTRTIVPYLGARYRRYLKPEARQLVLQVNIANRAKVREPIYSWCVEQVAPVYFHPATRDNRPVIHRHTIRGATWEAELTFGYAPHSEEEYEELGLDAPTKFHPYKVSLNRQGLDILLHDRVILFHQLSELEIVAMRHNDYNDVRGEIALVRGFSTAITKNAIIHDDNFRDCISCITRILNGEAAGPNDKIKDYLARKTYPEEIPEILLRDRLSEWLANNPVNKRDSVSVEYVVEGIEGFIDIRADDEAWEIKTDQATARDVYQLFMYMDVGHLSKGFLVAKSFSPGAVVAAKHVKTTHAKEIVLAERSNFPINHPPSTTEREEYY